MKTRLLTTQNLATLILASLVLVCSLAIQPVHAAATADDAKEQLAYTVGVQAYLYGQPMMDLYRTFYEGTLDPKRGDDRTLNEFNPARKLTTPKDTWVVSPNSDTLYLRSYLDLTDEPVVLHIPDMGERKFWFPLGNMYHNLLGHLSWDTIGFKGGDYALCAPGWQGVLPDGVKRVDMTTPMMWSLGRYAVSGQDDVAAVNKLQDKTWYVPLSQWKKDMTSAPRAKIDPGRYPVFTKKDMTDPQKYFTTMNEMLRRNPPLAKDHALLGWFREINLHPEQQFDWNKLDPATQKGLTRAAADALKIIEQKEKSFAKRVNGWVEAILEGDMSDDPVNHAGVTKMGLLYSQKEVSTYHVGYLDGDNKPLNGANKYIIKFNPVPPVDAFWSVTMYDAKTQLYIENKINRYAFGDRTPGLQKDKDGSVTIYLQVDEPTDPKAKANWLPAPKGAFYLALREYSPKPAILTRGWVPPAVQKVK